MAKTSPPIVGVICDKEIIGPHPFHIAGDKYLQAMVKGSNVQPILIPALSTDLDMNQIVNLVDGLLFTGGYSMVDPLHYQDEAADQETKLDKDRDNSSLPLIKLAIENNIPVLGICRGFQEMNVAFGGSLHQKLHQHAQFIEHREDKKLTLEQQYNSSHSVQLTENGKLQKMLLANKIDVNSLHTQGVDRLAAGLTIEATAPDGLIEAFSVDSATTFAMAFQWHPEWKFQNDIHSVKIFNEFGKACTARKQDKKYL